MRDAQWTRSCYVQAPSLLVMAQALALLSILSALAWWPQGRSITFSFL
jgi:hypothetical protein